MKLIDLLAIIGSVGIVGYFAYKVILPNLEGITLPSLQLQFPQFQFNQPPSQYGTAPATGADDTGSDVASKQQQQPSATTPPLATASGSNTPETLGYKSTGKKVIMKAGGDPAGNGRRYNADHHFKNYLSIGHYKIGTGQQVINHKTDGPNHNSNQSSPKYVWTEPNLVLSSGKLVMNGEWPHPKSQNDRPCPSCKTIGAIQSGQWFGWAVAAWQEGPYRKLEVWADKSGTGAQWQKIASELDTGQITTPEYAKRPVPPADGSNLEAEIRMHKEKGGTDMRDAWVYEIIPPTTTTTLQASNMRFRPYIYNSFYNRRRL